MDLHENWTFKILVPRSSLLVARCLSKQYLRFVTKPADKSITFNKNDGIPARSRLAVAGGPYFNQ